jgi:hypothetical protein
MCIEAGMLDLCKRIDSPIKPTLIVLKKTNSLIKYDTLEVNIKFGKNIEYTTL